MQLVFSISQALVLHSVMKRDKVMSKNVAS